MLKLFPYRIKITDDEGYLTDAGKIHIVGRIDDLINSGGEKIDVREVIDAIDKTGLASNVQITCRPDDIWQQIIHCDCELKKGSSLSDLKDALRDRLAPYKIPRSFSVSDAEQ